MALEMQVKKSKATTIKNIQGDIINAFKHLLREVYVLDARVVSINKEKSIFVVQDIFTHQFIECITLLNDFNDLKENDDICLLGKLRLDKNNIGRVVLDVELFFKQIEKDYMEERLLGYHQRKQSLFADKRKSVLDKIKKRNPPHFIRNIGVIAITSELNSLKEKFLEKCNGKLVICHLSKNHIEKQFIYCMEYLKKYHYIDLICVIVDKLNTHSILGLSSKDNIRYLISRTNFPYLAYVTIDNRHDQLLNILANANFHTVESCVDFIHGIQSNFMKQIAESIADAKTQIHLRIDEYETEKNILSDTIARKLFSLGFESSENLLTRVKTALSSRIDNLINDLRMKEVALMQTLIEDDEVTKYLDNSVTENIFGFDLIPTTQVPTTIPIEWGTIPFSN